MVQFHCVPLASLEVDLAVDLALDLAVALEVDRQTLKQARQIPPPIVTPKPLTLHQRNPGKSFYRNRH